MEAMYGKAPLFAVRLTHLGDGSSILAVTWLHQLADGVWFLHLDALMYATVDASLAISTTVSLGR